METTELHRGRLIDHIQLVVRDLEASRAFYTAVLDVLQVPMGGEETASSGRTNSASRPPTARPRRAG